MCIRISAISSISIFKKSHPFLGISLLNILNGKLYSIGAEASLGYTS